MHPLDEKGLTDMRELGGGGMTSPAIGLRQPWAGDGCVQGKQRLFLCMSEPEEAMGPPEFSRSVFPSQQGGADYALYISMYLLSRIFRPSYGPGLQGKKRLFLCPFL